MKSNRTVRERLVATTLGDERKVSQPVFLGFCRIQQSRPPLRGVDYHDQNCVVRRRGLMTHEEQVLSIPTTAGDLLGIVKQSRFLAGRRGRVVRIQERTSG
jgi:hypothetical protein